MLRHFWSQSDRVERSVLAGAALATLCLIGITMLSVHYSHRAAEENAQEAIYSVILETCADAEEHLDAEGEDARAQIATTRRVCALLIRRVQLFDKAE